MNAHLGTAPAQQPPKRCSLPLRDADLGLGNANWTKGLQSMSDWIWSGQLNPKAFPNHLARFFLHTPGIFEQQLNFSTTLIFDEPSFRNGVQVSGFLDRAARELVIQFIGQKRRAQYTMTHHAVLGRLTCIQHGLSEREFSDKWYRVLDFRRHPGVYSDVERELLEFADAFATNPKSYDDEQYERLRGELRKENRRCYPETGLWLARLQAARAARAEALAAGLPQAEADKKSRQAADAVTDDLPEALNDRMVNAQVIELAFLCLQFVALTDVFSALRIPDEEFLAGVMAQLVPQRVIDRIGELIALGGEDMPELVPPSLQPPLQPILDGKVKVAPAPLKGARVPMTPYEGRDENDFLRPAFLGAPDVDKGLTIGGIQVGTYGWGFGGHFPGSLVYALMHHPELARFEAPYSLPVLFNEDEWRNGVQTAGFVTRRLKELVIQKIYKVTRSRYGIEHHTMFLYNAYKDEYGVGRAPHPNLGRKEVEKSALEHADRATIYMHQHRDAPRGVYTELEKAALDWTEQIVRNPHEAQDLEGKLRQMLAQENEREANAGLRRLDTSHGIGKEAALRRLQDHQIAELAMMIGHMDGLGRALTILRLEAEEPVLMVKGKRTEDWAYEPELDPQGRLQFTGYFNNRPGLHEVYGFIGISDAALTVNELMVNPLLNEQIMNRLKKGRGENHFTGTRAAQTGEF